MRRDAVRPLREGGDPDVRLALVRPLAGGHLHAVPPPRAARRGAGPLPALLAGRPLHVRGGRARRRRHHHPRRVHQGSPTGRVSCGLKPFYLRLQPSRAADMVVDAEREGAQRGRQATGGVRGHQYRRGQGVQGTNNLHFPMLVLGLGYLYSVAHPVVN